MKPRWTSAEKDIRRQAAAWIALKEARPLTLKEQADLADWRGADSRHEQQFERLSGTWTRLDQLQRYPHSPDQVADPLLLATPRVRPFLWQIAPLAAAALVAVAAVWWFKPWQSNSTAESSITAGSPIVHLADGSTVELRGDAYVRDQFTDAERRITLVRGEAHFTVAKNKDRPFIVEANGVFVRAVGTAFNVRLERERVEVLVTEGHVEVNPPSASPTAETPDASLLLKVGQLTKIPTLAAMEPEAPKIENVAPAEIDRILAWQGNRFVFEEMPISDVLVRLNRQLAGREGSVRLVLEDPRMGGLRISGRIRPDEYESLVESLEMSFGIIADRSRGDVIVLRPRAP